MKEIKWLQDFDNDHTDSIWYGGDIVSIRLERYNVIIGAYGDVRAWIDDEHYCDKNNGGCFKEYLEEHGIYNDDDLRQAISENRIEFEHEIHLSLNFVHVKNATQCKMGSGMPDCGAARVSQGRKFLPNE